jgi:hypothetical protein
MRIVTRPLAVVLAALVAGCGVSKYDDVPRPVDSPPVEIAPPVISQKPPALTNLRSATFAFAAADAGAPGPFRCRLDTGEPSACTSPVSYQALADGSHTFTVEQLDAAGGGHAATYDWSVDGTAPAVSITGHPDPLTASTTATFAFGATVASEAATFRCRVDSGELAACQSGASFGPLGDGGHRFDVEATDPLGNSTVASWAWTVDATGPTIDAAGPATLSALGAAVFMFAATDANGLVTFRCRLDSGPLAPCESGQRYDVADGPHAFTLEARDAVRNVSVWQRAWTVDTAAPAVTLSVEPAALTSSTTARFEFSATDQGGGVSFACTLDGASTSCTSPSSYTVAEGPHTFTVTASDAVGHSAAASRTWTVDATGPALAFITKPGNSNDRTAGFAFTATDAHGPVTVTCSLDGETAVPCSSPVSYLIPGTSQGTAHRFTIQGEDGVGNVSTLAWDWEVAFGFTCFNFDSIRDPLEGCDDGFNQPGDGCYQCMVELDHFNPIATVETSGTLPSLAVTASGTIYLRQSGGGAAPDSFVRIAGDPAVVTSDAVPGVLGRWGGDVMAIGEDLVFGSSQSGTNAYLQKWTASTNTTTTLAQFATASVLQSFAVNTAVDRVFYAGVSGPIFKATGPSTSAPFWTGNVTDLLYDRARDRLYSVLDGTLKVDASGGAGTAGSFTDLYSNLNLRDVAVDSTGMLYATCYAVDPATSALTACSSPGPLVAIQISNGTVTVASFVISNRPVTRVAYDPGRNGLVLLTTEQLAGSARVRTRVYRVTLN